MIYNSIKVWNMRLGLTERWYIKTLSLIFYIYENIKKIQINNK